MTEDVQHDRSDAPLASVSDETHPPHHARIPEATASDSTSTATDAETTATFDSESFAGFGSFG